MCVLYLVLRTARRRFFTGAERGSRFLQGPLMCSCGRVRAAEDAPRDPFRLLERRHSLAQIVERGIVVLVERLRITPTHQEREVMVISKDASRHWHCFEQQRLNFCVAL